VIAAGTLNFPALPVPDFPQFCEELGQPLHIHQLRMWDVLEGREPRDLLPVFRYTRGTEWLTAGDQPVAGRVIVNLPPGHGKTTTFSINYSTWLIHKNPNLKIIVVSKDQGLAKQILGAVKFRLTSPVYRDIHARYAPEGGWKDPDASWTQTEIYVQGKGDGEKDPTMQALGIGGRIYGARSDVILLDDAITLTNVNEYDKQSKWLDQEVESRLDGAGLLALLGTRIAPTDLYSHMREVTDADDEKVYTYFSMPAVLDEGAGTADEWVTLWPFEVCKDTDPRGTVRCFRCLEPDCSCGAADLRPMRPKFSAARLRKIRRNEATWALVYQQQDVSEDATFAARAVEASINAQRFPGPMTDAGMGHRPGGMEGLYRIGTVDPAAAGCTAMIIGGVERATGKRWVVDGFNNKNTSAQLLKDTIKRFTEAVRTARVGHRGQRLPAVPHPGRRVDVVAAGPRLQAHPPLHDRQQDDPDFGVMSMAPLFASCGEPPSNGGGGKWRKTPETALIELPAPVQNAWVSELINQLVVWQPSGMKQLQKTDLVMALWFFDIGCRKVLGHGQKRPGHLNNPYAASGRLRDRASVNLADYRAEALERRAA
jgi:hypothetical protein